MFPVSATVIVLFVIAGTVFEDRVGTALAVTQSWILRSVGWWYIVGVAGLLAFVVYLGLSRFGSVKLGKDDDEPDYGFLTWFAMLFSAGMGIGLLFFGVAEPMYHFAAPRDAPPESIAAAREAMTTTFFHWGLHAWGVYVVVGMSLAYFAFRHDLPLSLRSALYPLIGRRVHGAIGNIVDIVAVFGTLFGLATSLGLGVMQISAGLEYLGLFEATTTVRVILIAVITLLATISVVTGLDVGIRRLSELNLIAATALLLFVLIAGPTSFLISNFVQNIGRYAASFVPLTFRTDALAGEEGLAWQQSWTMFYWAWWISWSPFVGMFIARVSRGRTIREFVGGVLAVPTIVTFFWLTVFGDTALFIDLSREGATMATAVVENLDTSLFVMLEQLPLSGVSAALAIFVVTTFFITSSDSGSLVIDMITSGGHKDPPIPQRVFWALCEGAVAAVLLLAGGAVGLRAMRDAAIITAFPLSFVLVLACVGLYKGLRAERITADPFAALLEPRQKPTAVRSTPEPLDRKIAVPLNPDEHWDKRLKVLLGKRAAAAGPTRTALAPQLAGFLDGTVRPVFQEIGSKLEAMGRGVDISRGERFVAITVHRDGAEEFSYAIHALTQQRPTFAYPEHRETSDSKPEQRAEAVLRSGRHGNRRVTEWTRDVILDDFIRSYAKWVGW